MHSYFDNKLAVISPAALPPDTRIHPLYLRLEPLFKSTSILDVNLPVWRPGYGPAQGVRIVIPQHCPQVIASENGLSIIKFISLKPKKLAYQILKKQKTEKEKKNKKK